MDEKRNEVRSHEGMQNIAVDFYTELWSKMKTCTDCCQARLLSGLSSRLSDEDTHRLDAPVSRDELFAAIDGLAKDKTPGLDGLPAEFYQTYKSLFADRFVSLCNTILSSECTSSQKTAVISLLFKKENRSEKKKLSSDQSAQCRL